MDNGDWFFLFLFLFLFFCMSFNGEKTSHQDDDIDDYWSGD